MNAVGYLRKSTEEQSHYSLQYQERGITNYCNQNNLTLTQLFIDDGESSYTFDRPQFKALEAFVKKDKSIRYLIVYDIDRFSRNLAEALSKIKELRDKYDLKVLSITDRLDTDHGNSSEFLMRAFKLMMAENELMKIRERVKQGKIQAAMGGYWPTTAPFGYVNKRLDNGRATLEIQPQKAKIIKKIFDLTIKGLSPVDVRKEVPEFKMNHKQAIKNVITNPAYMGMVKVPEFKGRKEYYVKGVHKGIVSEEIFNLAQGKPRTQTRIETLPLKGVLSCWCGRLLTTDRVKGRSQHYHYYLCAEHRKYLSANALHKQLSEILSLLSLNDEQAEYLRASVNEKVNDMLRNQGEDTEVLKKEITALKRKISDTEEKYLSNQEISVETFNKVMTELKAQKSRADIKLRAISATNTAYMAHLEFLLPKLNDIAKAYDLLSVSGKQAFIKEIFGESLNHTKGIYRTVFINPLFSHNVLSMIEKGLLKLEQPLVKLDKNSCSGADRTKYETDIIEDLYRIFKTA